MNRKTKRMIAAAPAMLEALKAILKHDIPGLDPKVYELAEDAIHKAEGRYDADT